MKEQFKIKMNASDEFRLMEWSNQQNIPLEDLLANHEELKIPWYEIIYERHPSQEQIDYANSLSDQEFFALWEKKKPEYKKLPKKEHERIFKLVLQNKNLATEQLHYKQGTFMLYTFQENKYIPVWEHAETWESINAYRKVKPANLTPQQVQYRFNAVVRFLLVCIYATHKKDIVRKETITKQVKSAKSKSSSKKRKPPTFINIKNVTYTLDFTEGYEPSEKETREFQRLTESWLVRGHWRTYKSGKRVWIPAYKKGNKQVEITPKTYTVDVVEGE